MLKMYTLMSKGKFFSKVRYLVCLLLLCRMTRNTLGKKQGLSYYSFNVNLG